MKQYVSRNWPYLIGGGMAGLGLALYVALAARSVETIIVAIAFPALFTWPFSLKSRVGRIWWAAWLIAVMGLIGVRVDGLKSPAGWVLVCLTAASFGAVVSVRWRPPALT